MAASSSLLSIFINIFISAYYIHFKRFCGRQHGRFYDRFDSSIAAAIADAVRSCESGQEASGACVIGFLEDYFSTPESWSVQTSARTDGYGRSDTRAELREFFEISRYYIAVAALKVLADEGGVPHSIVVEALRKYGLDPEKPSPLKA